MNNFKYNAQLYDLQIDWEARLAREMELLLHIINKYRVNSILDIGCGTGHHLQALSGYVDKLVGLDPLKDTIEYAQNKVVTAKNVTLKVAGFEDLGHMDLPEFDLVMSLGNTLTLPGTRRKVKQALKHCRKKLSKEGAALFQFLNFNRSIIEKNSYYRPKVVRWEGKQYLFLKHFNYGRIKTKADFIIAGIGDGDKVEHFEINSSLMCTLKRSLFISMAKNAGYSDIELRGPSGKEGFNYQKDISLYALLNK